MTLDDVVARARKLRLITATRSYRTALVRYRVAASTEHHNDPLPVDIRTVIDVGANRGQFALVAGERWPNAHLYCFEPLPAPRAVLERVLSEHARAEIFDLALAATAGTRTLHLSRADDSSSLLPITDRQTQTFPGTDEITTLPVQTVSLDDHFAGGVTPPVLLKIDVQGFELEVLRGATALLESVDSLLVECSFEAFYSGQALADEVIAFLHRCGFALSGASSPCFSRNGVMLQVDLIFRRRAT